MKEIILVGYSGHALVAADILVRSGYKLKGYMEPAAIKNNLLQLEYLGTENDADNLKKYLSYNFFICIGDNNSRKKVSMHLEKNGCTIVNAIDPSAMISSAAVLYHSGIMVGSNSIINPYAQFGEGVICNTASVIEHECIIGRFAHIGPRAVVCGKVKVGECTLVGAGAVVKEGVAIGRNVIIGAGTIVIRDLPDNCKVVGNPARIL